MEFIGANLALGVRVILSSLRAKFVPGREPPYFRMVLRLYLARSMRSA